MRFFSQVSHQSPGVIRLPEETGSPGVTLIYPLIAEEAGQAGALDHFSHSDRTAPVPLSTFIPTGCVGADYCEEGDVPDYPDPATLRLLLK